MATTSLCQIPECSRIKHARGLCGSHYSKARLDGSLPITRPARHPLNRFGSFTTFDPELGCTRWTGATSGGYGMFWADGKAQRASRWIWEHLNGPIEGNLYILHTCDNGKRGCVEIDHLYVGTARDNARDAAARGVRGADHWNAKLSRADIVAIRNAVKRGNRADLALQYGVAYATICKIASGHPIYAGVT